MLRLIFWRRDISESRRTKSERFDSLVPAVGKNKSISEKFVNFSLSKLISPATVGIKSFQDSKLSLIDRKLHLLIIAGAT